VLEIGRLDVELAGNCVRGCRRRSCAAGRFPHARAHRIEAEIDAGFQIRDDQVVAEFGRQVLGAADTITFSARAMMTSGPNPLKMVQTRSESTMLRTFARHSDVKYRCAVSFKLSPLQARSTKTARFEAARYAHKLVSRVRDYLFVL